MTAVIKFNNVSKTFRSGKTSFTAVKNVSLEVKLGEIFGIIGHSGAGKSTLVRLINQLETITDGELTVLGESVGHLGEMKLRDLRSQIGMIFQSFNLFGAKNVFKNVEFPLKIAKVNKEERKARVLELLDFVGLKEKAKSYPGRLSGGQKQRVAIARALATNPQILLADEATSALDPETTLDVLRLLRKVNRELGVTIILITHTMSIVRMICDRVGVMADGEIAEVGTVKELFDSPTSEITKEFVRTFKIMDSGILDDYNLGDKGGEE